MIEKNIFQTWYTKSLHPLINQKIENLKNLNPDYKYYLYTDDDIDNFVNEHFPGQIAECYNMLNIIVAKTDLWRYLVLYKYGGVYLDMDSTINMPLDTFIREDDCAIISGEGNLTWFLQWGLIFSKEHPILRRTVEHVIDNIKNNRYPNDIHQMTGPTVFTKAIKEIHSLNFNCELKISKTHDMTYKNNELSYRVYGVDYNNHFSFSHEFAPLLYINKKHWRQEEREKELLKSR